MRIEDSDVVIDHYVDCNGAMVGLMAHKGPIKHKLFQ